MPNTAPTLVEQFAEAEQHFQQGRLQDALSLCKSILDSDPQFAHAYYLMGALFKTTGNLQKAIQFSDQAIRMEPKVADFHLQRGQSMFMLGETAEAKKSLEQAYSLNPQKAMVSLLLGDVYAKERQLDKAIEFFQKSLAIEPMADAYEHMGLCLHLKGDRAGARQAFEEAIKRKPQQASLYVNLARLQLEQNEIEQAEGSFARAFELNSEADDAAIALANFAKQRKDLKRAATLSYTASNLKPENKVYALFAGEILLQLNCFAEAEIAFKRVIDIEPNNIPATKHYINMLIQQQKLSEALVFIDKVLEKDPHDEVMRYFRSAFSGQTVDTAPQIYVAKLFDEYADKFDQHLQEGLSYHTPELLADALRQVMAGGECPNPPYSLLDLGCGTGLGAIAIQDITHERIGVDLSERMIQKAQEKGIYSEAHVADIVEFMQQSTRQFDLVAAVDVLVYIGNLEPTFAGAQRVLKSGGVFAFSVESGDDNPPYVLRSTARYAHAKDYIFSMAQAHGFAVMHCESVVVRHDHNKPLSGYVVVLQKAAVH